MPVILIGSMVVTAESAAAAGPSTPVLVSPSSGGSVNSAPGQLFTVRATDPNGDPYYATVELSTGGTFTTAVVPSGQDSTGTPALPIPPGTHSWRAKATTKADTSTSPPGGTLTDLDSAWSAWQPFTVLAAAPSVPDLVTPANGGAVNGGPGQIFTVRSTDPDGDPYHATIEVVVTGLSAGTVTFDTTPGPSGERVTGTPVPPIPPGTHTWRARSVDIWDNVSAWSAYGSFTATAPANTGVGHMSGEVEFTGPGQPGLLQDCGETDFTLTPTVVDSHPDLDNPEVDGPTNGIIINIAGSDYIGPIEFNGGGSGDCSNGSAGSGTLYAEVTGDGPLGAELTCSVTGNFARVLSVVDATMTGSCTINNFDVDNIVFRVQAAFRPDPGQGLSQPVTHAIFAGYFTVTAG